MVRHFVLASLLALASSNAAAVTCEELREKISAKINAAGVESFSVTIVDMDAKTDGKVVGTCARGAKKLVYRQSPRTGESSTPSGASHNGGSKPRPHSEPILTECKDGSVSVGGNCKQ